MAKVTICKRDGTPTNYFFSSKESDRSNLTVYKQTTDGVKRMKGVHFDAIKNTMSKQ